MNECARRRDVLSYNACASTVKNGKLINRFLFRKENKPLVRLDRLNKRVKPTHRDQRGDKKKGGGVVKGDD